MKNKYYIPKIEDLSFGMEIQHSNCVLEPKEEDYKDTIVCLGNINSIGYDLTYNGGGKEQLARNNSIRVKYLDKEDIEGLDFRYIGRTVVQWFSMIGAFYTPGERHRLTEYKLTYDSDNNELKIEGFFGKDSEGVLFEGIIKNKSELRKLMYQLNIIKDEK